MSSQDFQSRMGSPKKYYRWFRGHTHGYLNHWYKPQAIISSHFAFLPTYVDNKIIFFQTYYKLKTISSAFSFGGTTSLSYKTTKKSMSLFGFRPELKEAGIIVNLVAEKRKAKDNFNSWPPEFQKQFAKYFN